MQACIVAWFASLGFAMLQGGPDNLWMVPMSLFMGVTIAWMMTYVVYCAVRLLKLLAGVMLGEPVPKLLGAVRVKLNGPVEVRKVRIEPRWDVL